MSWNGIFSQSFKVENGVRQGGIISRVLFCLYTDDLLQQLRNSGVGCYIAKVYDGAHIMLHYLPRLLMLWADCRVFVRIIVEFSVGFNASKSV